MEPEVAKTVVQPWLVFAVISAAEAVVIVVCLYAISFKNKHIQKARLQRDRAIRAAKKAKTALETAGMSDEDLAKDIDEAVKRLISLDRDPVFSRGDYLIHLTGVSGSMVILGRQALLEGRCGRGGWKSHRHATESPARR